MRAEQWVWGGQLCHYDMVPGSNPEVYTGQAVQLLSWQKIVTALKCAALLPCSAFLICGTNSGSCPQLGSRLGSGIVCMFWMFHMFRHSCFRGPSMCHACVIAATWWMTRTEGAVVVPVPSTMWTLCGYDYFPEPLAVIVLCFSCFVVSCLVSSRHVLLYLVLSLKCPLSPLQRLGKGTV
jgi:hypothetical protein